MADCSHRYFQHKPFEAAQQSRSLRSQVSKSSAAPGSYDPESSLGDLEFREMLGYFQGSEDLHLPAGGVSRAKGLVASMS